MEPQEFTQTKFRVIEVLYNFEKFSIAFGVWDSSYESIAMRWNESETSQLGYPNSFGKPVWFLIPKSLSKPILTSLETNLFLKVNRNTLKRIIEKL